MRLLKRSPPSVEHPRHQQQTSPALGNANQKNQKAVMKNNENKSKNNNKNKATTKANPQNSSSPASSSTNTSTSSSGTKLLPFVVLAKRRRFDDIERLLNDSNVNHNTWLTLGGIQKEGTTALHILLEHCPPLDLVVSLIDRLQSIKPNFEVPEQARHATTHETPLHVAVRHGCDIAIVHRLLQGITGSFPATLADDHGHLPLHIACFHKRTGSHQMGESAKLIKLLLAYYPEGANVRDHKGRTPLDYAKHMIFQGSWNTKEFQKAGARCHVAVPHHRDRSQNIGPVVLRITSKTNETKEEETKEEQDSVVPGSLVYHQQDGDSDAESVVSDLTNQHEFPEVAVQE